MGLKNNEIKMELNEAFFKAMFIRAIKTLAQSFISVATLSYTSGEIDWKFILSSSLLAALLSMATSLTGLPEVKTDGEDSTISDRH